MFPLTGFKNRKKLRIIIKYYWKFNATIVANIFFRIFKKQINLIVEKIIFILIEGNFCVILYYSIITFTRYSFLASSWLNFEFGTNLESFKHTGILFKCKTHVQHFFAKKKYLFKQIRIWKRVYTGTHMYESMRPFSAFIISRIFSSPQIRFLLSTGATTNMNSVNNGDNFGRRN